MWLFTNFGFFSAVEFRDDPRKVMVRTRSRKDIEALLDRHQYIGPVDISYTPTGDYPYRIVLPKPVWAQMASDAAMSIDYDNFKSSVGAQQGWNRSYIYHDVWSACLKITKEEAQTGDGD
ncbi:MAG: hypothetical protein EBT03_08120 [Betaproteobacteria bacterium]|nr:hypothetical protein [Betaproteobacteria bacterium]NCA17153.1 hypothetical protein [Betaproteobacteria bacterium]